MRGTRNGHAAAAALSLFGKLQVDLAVVSGDQAVVEVVVLDLQEDGVAVQVRAVLEEVHTFRGDEDAVAVDQLHRDETGEDKHTRRKLPVISLQVGEVLTLCTGVKVRICV